jgi:hypothetical protein
MANDALSQQLPNLDFAPHEPIRIVLADFESASIFCPMSGAVFLSYAREDTAAAQRIAEALRSHGVEVWFDQNELRSPSSEFVMDAG